MLQTRYKIINEDPVFLYSPSSPISGTSCSASSICDMFASIFSSFTSTASGSTSSTSGDYRKRQGYHTVSKGLLHISRALTFCIHPVPLKLHGSNPPLWRAYLTLDAVRMDWLAGCLPCRCSARPQRHINLSLKHTTCTKNNTLLKTEWNVDRQCVSTTKQALNRFLKRPLACSFTCDIM